MKISALFRVSMAKTPFPELSERLKTPARDLLRFYWVYKVALVLSNTVEGCYRFCGLGSLGSLVVEGSYQGSACLCFSSLSGIWSCAIRIYGVG